MHWSIEWEEYSQWVCTFYSVLCGGKGLLVLLLTSTTRMHKSLVMFHCDGLCLVMLCRLKTKSGSNEVSWWIDWVVWLLRAHTPCWFNLQFDHIRLQRQNWIRGKVTSIRLILTNQSAPYRASSNTRCPCTLHSANIRFHFEPHSVSLFDYGATRKCVLTNTSMHMRAFQWNVLCRTTFSLSLSTIRFTRNLRIWFIYFAAPLFHPPYVLGKCFCLHLVRISALNLELLSFQYIPPHWCY